MLGVGIVAVLLAEPVVAVFIRTQSATATETVRLGAEYLRVMAVAFAFVGAFQVFLGAFLGPATRRPRSRSARSRSGRSACP
jgi:Na+-driven multidrug efflux pump